MITYTNGRGQFTQAYVKKYVAWLHVLIALCTTQGSHVHTLFLRWYALVVFETEWKNNCNHSHFSQFQIVSHSASTVLIQQEPFSAFYFDGQVPSLQIRITVLFSTDLQTPRTALPGFPATLSVFWNVSTHFFYPCAHLVVASFTRCRLKRRKLNTYRDTHSPSWENGTRQVPSQLPHSDFQSLFDQNTNTLCYWFLKGFDGITRAIMSAFVLHAPCITLWLHQVILDCLSTSVVSLGNISKIMCTEPQTENK